MEAAALGAAAAGAVACKTVILKEPHDFTRCTVLLITIQLKQNVSVTYYHY